MEIFTPVIIGMRSPRSATCYFKGFSGIGRPLFDVNPHRARIMTTLKEQTAYLKFIPIMRKSFRMFDKVTLFTVPVAMRGTTPG